MKSFKEFLKEGRMDAGEMLDKIEDVISSSKNSGKILEYIQGYIESTAPEIVNSDSLPVDMLEELGDENIEDVYKQLKKRFKKDFKYISI